MNWPGIYPQQNSPYYRAVITDAAGKRRWWSTGRKDPREAMLVALIVELDLQAAKEAGMSERDVRQLEKITSDLFRQLNRHKLPRPTFAEFGQDCVQCWSKNKSAKTAKTYEEHYEAILKLLGESAHAQFMHMAPQAAEDLFAKIQEQRQGESVKQLFFFAKRIFKRAFSKGLIREDPTADIQLNKGHRQTKVAKSKPMFTDEELEITYAYLKRKFAETEAAGEVSKVFYWRQFIALIASYETYGGRLNDICSWRMSNMDLVNDRVRFIDHKTRKQHDYRLVEVLKAYLRSLPSCDDPDPPVFPDFYCDWGKGAKKIADRMRAMLTAAGARKPGRELTARSFRRRVARKVGAVDLLSARDTLGHQKVDMTEVYAVKEQASVEKGIDISESQSIAAKLNLFSDEGTSPPPPLSDKCPQHLEPAASIGRGTD
jgi:integrase